MKPLRIEAGGSCLGYGLLEAGALEVRERGAGDFGGGEVGEEAFEMEVRVVLDCVEECVEFGAGGYALAGHAGVDFQVEWERGGGFVCGGGEPVDVLGEPDDGSEIVLEEERGVLRERRGHDEDAGLMVHACGGEGFADGGAFGGVGDA